MAIFISVIIRGRTFRARGFHLIDMAADDNPAASFLNSKNVQEDVNMEEEYQATGINDSGPAEGFGRNPAGLETRNFNKANRNELERIRMDAFF
jgi:hypothetical protein